MGGIGIPKTSLNCIDGASVSQAQSSEFDRADRKIVECLMTDVNDTGSNVPGVNITASCTVGTNSTACSSALARASNEDSNDVGASNDSSDDVELSNEANSNTKANADAATCVQTCSKVNNSINKS